MGFYLRKALRLGPLLLNLSRHGVDYSVGIRGACGPLIAGSALLHRRDTFG
jgi:hypothetical protein